MVALIEKHELAREVLFKSRSAAQHRQGPKTPGILKVFLVAAAHIRPEMNSLTQGVYVGFGNYVFRDGGENQLLWTLQCDVRTAKVGSLLESYGAGLFIYIISMTWREQ